MRPRPYQITANNIIALYNSVEALLANISFDDGHIVSVEKPSHSSILEAKILIDRLTLESNTE